MPPRALSPFSLSNLYLRPFLRFSVFPARRHPCSSPSPLKRTQTSASPNLCPRRPRASRRRCYSVPPEFLNPYLIILHATSLNLDLIILNPASLNLYVLNPEFLNPSVSNPECLNPQALKFLNSPIPHASIPSPLSQKRPHFLAARPSIPSLPSPPPLRNTKTFSAPTARGVTRASADMLLRRSARANAPRRPLAPSGGRSPPPPPQHCTQKTFHLSLRKNTTASRRPRENGVRERNDEARLLCFLLPLRARACPGEKERTGVPVCPFCAP